MSSTSCDTLVCRIVTKFNLMQSFLSPNFQQQNKFSYKDFFVSKLYCYVTKTLVRKDMSLTRVRMGQTGRIARIRKYHLLSLYYRQKIKKKIMMDNDDKQKRGIKYTLFKVRWKEGDRCGRLKGDSENARKHDYQKSTFLNVNYELILKERGK